MSNSFTTVGHLFDQEKQRKFAQDARKEKGMTSRERRRSAPKTKIKTPSKCQGFK